jgi:hypothetical protein
MKSIFFSLCVCLLLLVTSSSVQYKEQALIVRVNAIDVNTKFKGVYYLKIENNNQQYVSKFIKQ